MAYEKTEVVVSKSQEQIRRLVYAHKGSGLNLMSHPPREGFEALVVIESMSYHVRIMATCKARHSPEQRLQEERRVWRVLYHHLKAMFEASDSGVVDIRDVIMPYVVMKDGRTLSEVLKPRMPEIMSAPLDRLLPAGEA